MRSIPKLLSSVGLFLLPSLGAVADEFCEIELGCDQNQLCRSSPDTATKGAWSVGVKTVNIEALTAEVWYPAEPSAVPLQPKSYDLRQWLPPSEQQKIPDDSVPPQICDCVEDLPLDTKRGPYPVILFAHGTAAFRTQSLSLMTQLASRGFVVLAADHPGLYLGDLLQFKTQAQVATDLTRIVSALRQNRPQLSFLDGHILLDRLGLVGHSAGGRVIAEVGERLGAQLLVPMAAGGTQAGSQLKSTLVLGGLEDRVVPYSRQQNGFLASPQPKRLIGLSNAGHLAFSDLCALTNEQGEDLVAVAQRYRINNAGFASRLWDGCASNQLPPPRAQAIVSYSVTAAAQETLQCVDRSESFTELTNRYQEVGEFVEQLKAP